MTLRKDFNYRASEEDVSQGLAASNLYIDIYSVPNNISVGFKAFIKSFNDSLKLNWNIQEIGIGRMDPLVNFKNLERVINISFSVPAAYLDEAILNFGKLQTLQRFLYPNQELINGNALSTNMVAPPLIKILFMNWIKDESNISFDSAKNGGLLGYIDGISFNPKPEQDNYFFDDFGKAYPSNFEISFNFYVLNSSKNEKVFLSVDPPESVDPKKSLYEQLGLLDPLLVNVDKDFNGKEDSLESSRAVSEFAYTTDKRIIFKNPAYPSFSVDFPLFLKEFNDKFTSNWNKSEIFGKTDKLATFKNTNRKISFTFSVPSEDIINSVINYNRINNFFGILYPKYDKNLKITSVPYTSIRMLNWVSSGNKNNFLFGVINQLEFKPDMNSGFYAYKGRLYPTNFEVVIDFTVLHNKYLGSAVPYIDKNIEPIGNSKFPYSVISKYFEG
jgi:hypothetical protein